MKKAYVFPGQGSQYPGMAKDLYESNEVARMMLERANEILGFRITDIMFEGTAEELKQTRVTQPAIFLHSVVMARCIQDFTPDMVAGHSLGEFSALVAAGAIDFEEELKILRMIRQQFSAQDIELRVDANGAFSPTDAMDKLNRLAELDLHSIEQPIRSGQWEEMARLTTSTPLPIALDEELIGCNDPQEKKKLLSMIHPQYIILKPSLHGGIHGGNEWIQEAEKQHIGWWITSALESNIGLNAIAQWCATFKNPLPQGLGTGALFTDNIDMPLEVRKDSLWYNV